MKRFHNEPQAEADLDAITDYYAENNRTQEFNYLTRLSLAVGSLRTSRDMAERATSSAPVFAVLL